jgi:hypothetical protein
VGEIVSSRGLWRPRVGINAEKREHTEVQDASCRESEGVPQPTSSSTPKSGGQGVKRSLANWILASAGMTEGGAAGCCRGLGCPQVSLSVPQEWGPGG